MNSLQQSLSTYGTLISAGKFEFENIPPTPPVNVDELPQYYDENGVLYNADGTVDETGGNSPDPMKGDYIRNENGEITYYDQGQMAGNPILKPYNPADYENGEDYTPTTEFVFPVSVPMTAKNLTIIYTHISPVPDIYDVDVSSDGISWSPLITINPQESGATMTTSYLIGPMEWYTEMNDGLRRTTTGSFAVPAFVRVKQLGGFNPTLNSITVSVFYQ